MSAATILKARIPPNKISEQELTEKTQWQFNTGKVVDVLLLLDQDRAIKLLQIIIKD